MAYPILVLKKAQAMNVDSFNRSMHTGSTAAVEVFNGKIVELDGLYTPSGGVENKWRECFKAKATPTAGFGRWIVYTPEVVKVDGRYRGIDKDPREMMFGTNEVVDIFLPRVGDIIEITVNGFDSVQSLTVGDYVVLDTATSKFKRSATPTDLPTDQMSFKLIDVSTIAIPDASVNTVSVKSYILECTGN